MAVTKKEAVVETVEQAQQRIAQMEMDAQRKIDQMMKEAAEKEALAAKVLENAKLTAANIPHEDKKTFDQELAEAAKLTLIERMKRQFGDDNMIQISIPIDNESRAKTMCVTINGWDYEFRRGEVYEIPKAMLPVIMGSVYKDSDLIAGVKM